MSLSRDNRAENLAYKLEFKVGMRKLWWTKNIDRVRKVKIVVKDKLSKKVVEVPRKTDRIMAIYC